MRLNTPAFVKVNNVVLNLDRVDFIRQNAKLIEIHLEGANIVQFIEYPTVDEAIAALAKLAREIAVFDLNHP